MERSGGYDVLAGPPVAEENSEDLLVQKAEPRNSRWVRNFKGLGEPLCCETLAEYEVSNSAAESSNSCSDTWEEPAQAS